LVKETKGTIKICASIWKEIHSYRVQESNIGPLWKDTRNKIISFTNRIKAVDWNIEIQFKEFETVDDFTTSKVEIYIYMNHKDEEQDYNNKENEMEQQLSDFDVKVKKPYEHSLLMNIHNFTKQNEIGKIW